MYNSLLTAFISLFKTAFRLAFKKGAFTTLVPTPQFWHIDTLTFGHFGTISRSDIKEN